MRNYQKLKIQVNIAFDNLKKEITHLSVIAYEAKQVSKIARDTHIDKFSYDRQIR